MREGWQPADKMPNGSSLAVASGWGWPASGLAGQQHCCLYRQLSICSGVQQLCVYFGELLFLGQAFSWHFRVFWHWFCACPPHIPTHCNILVFWSKTSSRGRNVLKEENKIFLNANKTQAGLAQCSRQTISFQTNQLCELNSNLFVCLTVGFLRLFSPCSPGWTWLTFSSWSSNHSAQPCFTQKKKKSSLNVQFFLMS